MATLPLHLPFTPSSLTRSLRRRRSSRTSITGMAINDDDVHNQISTKMPSELGSDDVWSSLSSFMDDEGREPLGASATAQSLMGLSTSLFNDVNSFVMDKEDPAEYIPAPAISAEELELNTQLENILYVLREVLPGPMVKTGMDNKLLEAWSFVVVLVTHTSNYQCASASQ